MTNFTQGDQVIYIPDYIQDDLDFTLDAIRFWHYPGGIQPGFISSVSTQGCYFVRYWRFDHKQRVYLPELRTKANSERTNGMYLARYQYFAQRVVQDALNWIEDSP